VIGFWEVPFEGADHEEHARMSAQLEAQRQFVLERGGQRWIDTYVKPYYREWGSYGAASPHVVPLIPGVRDRAAELGAADISQMVRMPWRIQVMGIWYAIARADKTLAEPLHDAFDYCYGYFTSPGLTAAVLTYPSEATARVLRAYRERAIARKSGDAAIISTALQRLEPDPAGPDRAEEDDLLDRLLDVARQLQGHGT
jgi:hypothetical protein